MKAEEKQINELDSTLSTYQFCISTGSGFIVLSILKIVGYYNQDGIIFPLLILLVGLVLLFIAKYEHEDYTYTFWELHDEIIGSQKKS